MSQKKEILLTTAERLFYQNGFHAIGIKRIVSESGIAMMTLYNHFASKEDLILAVLSRRESRYLTYLLRQLEQGAKEGHVLRRLCRAHALWLEQQEQRGCMFLRAREEYGGDPGHMIVLAVDQHKQALSKWIQQLDADLSEAQTLQAMLLMEGATALAETAGSHKVGEQLERMANLLFPIGD
ncbi:TetR/AcrR family transcriptional regulator [Paenibacillus sp. 1P07SE]|uniref:TetR/AcrR family transcriptional regulator n=1 Tax=Paenibacillus sp. 1P07SE TaxID=3132209 RepID=UPI0039A69070